MPFLCENKCQIEYINEAIGHKGVQKYAVKKRIPCFELILWEKIYHCILLVTFDDLHLGDFKAQSISVAPQK